MSQTWRYSVPKTIPTREECPTTPHMAVSLNWGVLFVGVLISRAIPLEVYIRAPEYDGMMAQKALWVWYLGADTLA